MLNEFLESELREMQFCALESGMSKKDLALYMAKKAKLNKIDSEGPKNPPDKPSIDQMYRDNSSGEERCWVWDGERWCVCKAMINLES